MAPGTFCRCWHFRVLAIATVAFVVFIERGQRRITVNYPRRQVGNKMYAGQSSHLPLKVNMAGVIPAIFAWSILLFPASIGQWLGSAEGFEWLQDIAVAWAGAAAVHLAFRRGSGILLLLLYSAGVQPQGSG